MVLNREKLHSFVKVNRIVRLILTKIKTSEGCEAREKVRPLNSWNELVVDDQFGPMTFNVPTVKDTYHLLDLWLVQSRNLDVSIFQEPRWF